jgi:hypothetical protein
MVLHPIAFALDEDGLRMMEEPVEDSGSQGAVIIKNVWPVFERTVGGDDDGTLLVAQADDLKEQIGAVFVEGQVAQFVQNENGWGEILFELGFETVGGVGGGKGVDGIDGGGEEDGFALEACGITEGGGKMGFAHADAAKKDDIGFIIDEPEPEEVLDVEAIDFLGPTPLKLVEGFEDRETSKPDSALNRAVVAGTDLPLSEAVKIVQVGPVMCGGLLGKGLVMFLDEEEIEELQMGFQLWIGMIGFTHVRCSS